MSVRSRYLWSAALGLGLVGSLGYICSAVGQEPGRLGVAGGQAVKPQAAVSANQQTADTIAAQREAKQKGSKTLAICNVVGSMITREAAGTLLTHAGPEIGVASTKCFTAQLAALSELGCEYVQGFLLGRPLPPEQIGELL